MKCIFLFTLLFISLNCPLLKAATSSASPAVPSDIEIRDALQSLRSSNPERYKNLLQIRRQDPDKFTYEILSLVQEERRDGQIKSEPPENHAIKQKMLKNRELLRGLIQQYGTEKDLTKKTNIENQIEALLGEQYDLRSRMRNNRIQRVEKRLALMKQNLKNDSAEKKHKFIEEWKPKLLSVSGKRLSEAK